MIFLVWAVPNDPHESVDYDVVHSAVVVADSPEEAINILTTAPRLEVPETSEQGETMIYPLEFDPNSTLKAVAIDTSYKRVLHSHMHYG